MEKTQRIELLSSMVSSCFLDLGNGVLWCEGDVPHRSQAFEHLFLVGSSAWGGLGGVDLLEGVCHWERVLRFQNPMLGLFFLSAYGSVFKMLSYYFSSISVCFML